MPAQPTNCFICKKYWGGTGPICDDCDQLIHGPPPNYQQHYQNTYTPPPKPVCNFCGGGHDETDCLAASLAKQHNDAAKQAYIKRHAYSYNSMLAAAAAQMRQKQQTQAAQNMAKRVRHGFSPRPHRSKPYTNYYDDSGPAMKMCGKCHQRQVIESKAGSICMNCKALTRNACRCCTSTNTKGLTGEGMQFIECNDCQHIE